MTEGETTSSDPKKTPPLRSSSSSSSALVKQEPEFSKQSETSQKGVPRSDSPYEAGTVFLPIASKREGQPVMEASPLSRRKFDVSDVIVEGVNEKPSVTSQLSAESVSRGREGGREGGKEGGREGGGREGGREGRREIETK